MRFSYVLAALLLAASSVFAQEFRGTITGTVTDPSGAHVPRVQVKATLGNGASIDFPGRRIPRSQEVSIGFQRELPFKMVLDASYMGNFTNRLRVFVWDNGVMPYSELQQGIANPTLFNEQVPNPYYNLPGISASSTCGSNQTISRINLLLPLSQYCGLIGQYNDPLGKQFFNTLEVKLDKRVSHGLSFRMAYTYSKTMGATGYQNGWPYQDANLKYEVAGQDRTHVFSLTGEWDLPIGKGTNWIGTDAHGVVAR